MGVRTGVRRKIEHWSRRLIQCLGAKVEAIGYWPGANQAIRVSALNAIGGVNSDIEFGAGEDFYRVWNLVRFCKQEGFTMETGRSVGELDVPVYTSSRRTSTLWRILKNRIYLYRRGSRSLAEDGVPGFQEGKPSVVKKAIR